MAVTAVSPPDAADRPCLENAADQPRRVRRAFTFELRFSEEVKLSYKTLRDQSFTVIRWHGEESEAAGAGEQHPLADHGAEPDSDADVTVVLPATTDCDDPGAVCTRDGGRLSNSLELIVSGPSG